MDEFKLPITLKPKARKTGRPHLDKEMISSEERQDRAKFNASVAARQKLEAVMLLDVINSLDLEKPSLQETLMSDESIPVKFAEHAKKQPRYHHLRSPMLSSDAFYVLTNALVDICFA